MAAVSEQPSSATSPITKTLRDLNNDISSKLKSAQAANEQQSAAKRSALKRDRDSFEKEKREEYARHEVVRQKIQQEIDQQRQAADKERTELLQAVQVQLSKAQAERAEAATMLAGAQHQQQEMSNQANTLTQLQAAADLKLFCAKRQLFQSLLWAVSLGYAVWVSSRV